MKISPNLEDFRLFDWKFLDSSAFSSPLPPAGTSCCWPPHCRCRCSPSLSGCSLSVCPGPGCVIDWPPGVSQCWVLVQLAHCSLCPHPLGSSLSPAWLVSPPCRAPWPCRCPATSWSLKRVSMVSMFAGTLQGCRKLQSLQSPLEDRSPTRE